jgi:signal transduction histidine kinase
MKLKYLIFVLFTVVTTAVFSKNQDTIFFDNDVELLKNIHSFSIYEDEFSALSAQEVLKLDSFKINLQPSPNLGLTNSTFWINLKIKNSTPNGELLLGTTNTIIDTIELYEIIDGEAIYIETLGDNLAYNDRNYNTQFFLFDLDIGKNGTKEYLLKVKSWEQLVLPLFLGYKTPVFESNSLHDLIFGIFFGIMLVLILYNFFIFLSVKDNSYLFYVIYILFITLTQASLNGYTLRFLFPNSPFLSNISLIIFNCLAGIATVRFIQLFLKTKKHIPKLNIGFYIIAGFYVFGIISIILGLNQVSYRLMDIGGGLISFFSLFIAIKMSLHGNRYAKYFLLAWSIFLIGVMLFVLKNAGVLPSNNFTNHIMTFGISIEGIILSLALADRINIYKKERLVALEEKEKLVREQNIILEQRVNERTNELVKVNEELEEALNSVMETHSKLLESEKMASLGHLTAGIAHEINNPINFVSSNIEPLKRDLKDIEDLLLLYASIDEKNIKEKLKEVEAFKEEIELPYLKNELEEIINNIEEGARRTGEIVKGLKTFSRDDHKSKVTSDLNKGIKSSLTLVQNKLAGIHVETDLKKIPQILCYPGKLNQVFMNIIVNGIDAIKSKYENGEGGKLFISSHYEEDSQSVVILFKDNGIGIPKKILNKIYDPFFTTKDVGKGTGLGLSIVYKIIENHKGQILLDSDEKVGTTFKFILPVVS